MPQIAWATDIHLDFVSAERIEWLARALAMGGPDGIVLSGDLSQARLLEVHLEQLCSAIRVPVWFVLGNHDFYHGDIESVRARARRLGERSPVLRWLPACGVVELGSGWAMVGVDGWGDGRVGAFRTSPISLSDWTLIEDFAQLDRAERLLLMRRLGNDAASELHPLLDQALQRARRGVLVVTHVPPFLDASWHEGRVSDDDWAPWFVCAAVGAVLYEAALTHPDREILVVCGHTHGGGKAAILPNLRVLTGGAQYGGPLPQVPLRLQ